MCHERQEAKTVIKPESLLGRFKQCMEVERTTERLDDAILYLSVKEGASL